jgi:hypothetical protein
MATSTPVKISKGSRYAVNYNGRTSPVPVSPRGYNPHLSHSPSALNSPGDHIPQYNLPSTNYGGPNTSHSPSSTFSNSPLTARSYAPYSSTNGVSNVNSQGLRRNVQLRQAANIKPHLSGNFGLSGNGNESGYGGFLSGGSSSHYSTLSAYVNGGAVSEGNSGLAGMPLSYNSGSYGARGPESLQHQHQHLNLQQEEDSLSSAHNNSDNSSHATNGNMSNNNVGNSNNVQLRGAGGNGLTMPYETMMATLSTGLSNALGSSGYSSHNLGSTSPSQSTRSMSVGGGRSYEFLEDIIISSPMGLKSPNGSWDCLGLGLGMAAGLGSSDGNVIQSGMTNSLRPASPTMSASHRNSNTAAASIPTRLATGLGSPLLTPTIIIPTTNTTNHCNYPINNTVWGGIHGKCSTPPPVSPSTSPFNMSPLSSPKPPLYGSRCGSPSLSLSSNGRSRSASPSLGGGHGHGGSCSNVSSGLNPSTSANNGKQKRAASAGSCSTTPSRRGSRRSNSAGTNGGAGSLYVEGWQSPILSSSSSSAVSSVASSLSSSPSASASSLIGSPVFPCLV